MRVDATKVRVDATKMRVKKLVCTP